MVYTKTVVSEFDEYECFDKALVIQCGKWFRIFEILSLSQLHCSLLEYILFTKQFFLCQNSIIHLYSNSFMEFLKDPSLVLYSVNLSFRFTIIFVR